MNLGIKLREGLFWCSLWIIPQYDLWTLPRTQIVLLVSCWMWRRIEDVVLLFIHRERKTEVYVTIIRVLRSCFAFRSREIYIRCVRVFSFTVEKSLHHLPPSDRLRRESWPFILFHSSPSNNFKNFDRFFNRWLQAFLTQWAGLRIWLTQSPSLGQFAILNRALSFSFSLLFFSSLFLVQGYHIPHVNNNKTWYKWEATSVRERRDEHFRNAPSRFSDPLVRTSQSET